MGGDGRPRYRMPCCGRLSFTPPTAALCVDCAMAVTPLDDPIAVAYRARVAAVTPPRPSPETITGEADAPDHARAAAEVPHGR